MDGNGQINLTSDPDEDCKKMLPSFFYKNRLNQVALANTSVKISIVISIYAKTILIHLGTLLSCLVFFFSLLPATSIALVNIT